MGREKFSNKTAIITGAANGLGRALATELYSRGCNLALMDIDLAGLQQLKDNFQNNGQEISIHQADVSVEDDVITARQEILAHHKHIHLLINNAGICSGRLFSQLEMEDHKKIFEVNFWGTVHCTRHFLPDLEKQQKAWLVNVVSAFALMGFPGKTAYSASKAAIVGFTNSLQAELTGNNLKLSLVFPPPLDTGLVTNGTHIDAVKKQNEISFIRKNGMPLQKAAYIIINGIQKDLYRIKVGRYVQLADLASRIIPALLPGLIRRSLKRIDFI
jgi:short-subunit dehydrogenase